MSTILEALKRSQAMRDAAGGHGNAYPEASSGPSATRASVVRLGSLGLVVIAILATLAWLLFSNAGELSHTPPLTEPPAAAELADSATTASASDVDVEPLDSGNRQSSTDSPVAQHESGFTQQLDAGERIRQLTEQASSRRSEERPASQPARPATQWDTGPAEPRDHRRETRADTPAAETEPSRGHRLPENTIEWREFVRGYPRRPPELRLTVHRFHSDPSQRMAMINMRRYAPGDRIEPDVVLREIVPQGVVVRIGEQNVLLEAGR